MSAMSELDAFIRQDAMDDRACGDWAPGLIVERVHRVFGPDIPTKDITEVYDLAWYTDAERHFAAKADSAYREGDYLTFYRCIAAFWRLCKGEHFDGKHFIYNDAR